MIGCTSPDWAGVPERFGKLDAQAKITALARLAYEMTVLARDTYEPGTLGISDPARIRGINEVMHRVTSRLVDLLRGGADDWNEVTFWQALVGFAKEAGFWEGLTMAASIAAGEGQA